MFPLYARLCQVGRMQKNSRRVPAFWRKPGLIVVLATLCASILSSLLTSQQIIAADSVRHFLQHHWKVPIPLQGSPPATYSPLEASLHPSDCGICHAQQYKDWRTSLHSRAMSPGVYGQLLEMDPATVTICATCHTPLSEQIPYLIQAGRYIKNSRFDAALQQKGLVCAVCHVRQHQRFGPPRRASLPPVPAGTVLPHGGFTPNSAFQQSAFCKGCHQFEPDDFSLNGKLLENTYEEWRQSPYAEKGVQCQNCHMPNRRHLWRGIHDANMVKQALSVTITPDAPTYRPGDMLHAQITVTNSGAGHYLPTYVTPKIFVRAHLINKQGKIIAGSAQETVIGRDMTLNLAEELYDTRIAPLASHSFTYAYHLPPTAVMLRINVVVHPDHFYQRFFEAVLQNGGGGKGRSHLEVALRRTQTSSFTVFEQYMTLAPNLSPDLEMSQPGTK